MLVCYSHVSSETRTPECQSQRQLSSSVVDLIISNGYFITYYVYCFYTFIYISKNITVMSSNIQFKYIYMVSFRVLFST